MEPRKIAFDRDDHEEAERSFKQVLEIDRGPGIVEESHGL